MDAVGFAMIPLSFDSVGITSAFMYVTSEEKTCSSGSAGRNRLVFIEQNNDILGIKNDTVHHDTLRGETTGRTGNTSAARPDFIQTIIGPSRRHPAASLLRCYYGQAQKRIGKEYRRNKRSYALSAVHAAGASGYLDGSGGSGASAPSLCLPGISSSRADAAEGEHGRPCPEYPGDRAGAALSGDRTAFRSG